MTLKKKEKADWEYIRHNGCEFCDGDIKVKRCYKADGTPRQDFYFRCFANPEKGILQCNFRGQYEQAHINGLLKAKKIISC